MIRYQNKTIDKTTLKRLLGQKESVSGFNVNSPYFTFDICPEVYTLHLNVNGKYNKLAKDGKFLA